MKKVISKLGVLLLVIPFYLSLCTSLYAADITYDSFSDFSKGSFDENIDIVSSLGDVKLAKGTKKLTLAASGMSWDVSNNCLLSGDDGISISPSNLTPHPLSLEDYVTNLAYDATSGLIYYSDFDSNLLNANIRVIDTKLTASESDDSLLHVYNKTSSPFAILDASSVYVTDLDYKSSSNQLFIATYGNGLYIINTQGDKNTANDTLMHYETSSTPSLTSNNVSGTYVDVSRGLVYVISGNGVDVINVNSTWSNQSDDTISAVYSYDTTPTLIPYNMPVYDVLTFASGRYVALGFPAIGGVEDVKGVIVIDTHNTLAVGDDTVFARYRSSLFPSIPNDYVRTMTISPDEQSLYVGLGDLGMYSVNFNGTVNDPSDDTIGAVYSTSSTPALTLSNVYQSNGNDIRALSMVGNLLYVGSYAGLTIIDTKGTASSADDTIVLRASSNTLPSLSTSEIGDFAYNSHDSVMYSAFTYAGSLTQYTGFGTIDLHNTECTFNFKPLSTASGMLDQLTWTSTEQVAKPTFKYRYNQNTSNVWINDFNDGDPSEFVDDPMSYGENFTLATEANSILKISGPQSTWSMFGINTGLSADAFPAGSTFRMRYKVTRAQGITTDYAAYFYFDNYDDDADLGIVNQWATYEYTPANPFSTFGVEFKNLGVNDYIEIDWVSVEKPASSWSSWTPFCTTEPVCDLPTMLPNTYYEFEITLDETNATLDTVISNIEFRSGFKDKGVYYSEIIPLTSNVDKISRTVVKNVPSSTSTSLYLRMGDTASPDSSWTSWILFDSELSVNHMQYVQFRIDLETQAEEFSPVISSVVLKPEVLGASTEELPDTGVNILGIIALSLISISSGVAGYVWYDKQNKIT